jgi:hypothetical protein
MTGHTSSSPSTWARGLGYGGLVPFVGLTLALWFLPVPQQAMAATVLLAYSASILSFIGAIHWGLAMRDTSGPRTAMLLWGVVPSLMAWIALLLPTGWGLLLVAVILWSCFAADRVVYPPMGLRAWLPMRLWLTTVASASCIAGAVRISGVPV